MDIKYYKDATDFLAHAGRYLAQDEVKYGLVLGLSNFLVQNPHRYGADDPWFCTVGTGKNINAAAIRTPPHKIVLAYFSDDVKTIARKLVTAVYDSFKVVPGVLGDKGLADIFAGLWCKAWGMKIIDIQGQKIYRLVKVNNVPMAPGMMRVATEADRDLVKKWAHAFHIDIGGEIRHVPEADPAPGIEHNTVFLWEDINRPVSMAVKGRPTDKGMSVGYVYTPPELRGRGYATSCVAELSRNILQSGKEFCTLYTDLANPTSNSIYKKIGYQEVCDSVEYTFEIP